jgi:hypothetical protein
MRVRAILVLCCFCLGCHTFQGAGNVAGEANSAWEKGQEAMRQGDADLAITHYKQALAAKQPQTRAYLSLAAAYIAKEDEAGAGWALAQFIQAYPDHRGARFYYAEVLFKLGKAQEAQAQFELAVADLQQQKKAEFAQLVHCHGRLMEMAEAQEDEYQTHLNRGIALYWLAQAGAGGAPERPELSLEALLCKAAGELSIAHTLRPDEARPSWYLYSAWHTLGQTSMADACLREAREAAPFTYLTQAEGRSLSLLSEGTPRLLQ